MVTVTVLEARDLAVGARIDGAFMPVIRGLSFRLPAGRILGLVGESGAGKSMVGRAIALGVCDYLAETAGCPSQVARVPLEGSIIPVVEGMFKEGLALHGTTPAVDGALRATTAAWAVFGAARRWFQTPDRISAEEMAARIETMVGPVLFGGSQ